jgi:hypothetical protein
MVDVDLWSRHLVRVSADRLPNLRPAFLRAAHIEAPCRRLAVKDPKSSQRPAD